MVKSLHPGPGRRWFVEIAVLPFIRRYEFRKRWGRVLVPGALLTLLAILILVGFDRILAVPDPVKVILALACTAFCVLWFLLSLKFPATREDGRIYRDLVRHGVFLDEKGMTVNAFSIKDRYIPFESIKSFHVKILESSGNTEVISLDTADGEIVIPFLNLTDSRRIPIPGLLNDKGAVYYCYQPGQRCEVTAPNNDFYQTLRKLMPDREEKRRVERVKFQCPGCGDKFLIQTFDWHMRKRDILYCSECSQLVALDTSTRIYRDLFDRYTDQGQSTLISREQNLVTFRGTMAVEPKEYSFEILQGDAAGFDRIEKRGHAFQQAIEDALKPCSCGGHFSYQALPRCPYCRRTLPELVQGLGYGRYAVIAGQVEGHDQFK